jgi:hypothetical protein
MNLRNPVHRYSAAAVIALMAATMPAACGNGSGGYGGSGGGSGGGTMSVSVSEPAAGATVSLPFTVKIDSSVPLGDSASGRHHVHLYFDSNVNDYQVVETDTAQVTKAPAGQHVLHVSLRNANHSPAGAETQVTVVIGGGAGTPGQTSSPSPAPSSSPGNGYTYNY